MSEFFFLHKELNILSLKVMGFVLKHILFKQYYLVGQSLCCTRSLCQTEEKYTTAFLIQRTFLGGIVITATACIFECLSDLAPLKGKGVLLPFLDFSEQEAYESEFSFENFTWIIASL